MARSLLADFYDLLPDYRIGRIYRDTLELRPYAASMERWAGFNYLAVHRAWPKLAALVTDDS